MAPDLTARMRLAEMVLEQPLAGYLAARRAEGKSLRQITRDLAAATNGEVDVTEVTLRAWMARLDVAVSVAPAGAA